MPLLKQSSTAQPLLFLMVDSTDHVTGKTGLTPTVTLSKNGAAFASPAGAVTEVGVGWYKVAGNATDTATLGPLLLHATGTAADPVDDRYEVVAFDPQDTVRLGLTALPNAAAEAAGGLYTRGTGAGQINQPANGQIDANTVKVSGTVQTARDLGASVLLSPGTGTGQLNITSGNLAGAVPSVSGAVGSVTGNVGGNVTGSVGSVATGGIAAASFAAGAIDAAAIATDAIGSAELAASAVTKIQTGLATGSAQTTAQTSLSDLQTKVGTPAGASLSVDIAAVKTDTGNLITRITSTLFSGITSLAQWLGLLGGKQTGDTTARTEIRATGAGSGTYDPTTDSQEALRDRGDAAWTTGGGGSAPTAAENAAAVEASLDDRLLTPAQIAKQVQHLSGVLVAVAAAGGSTTIVPLNTLTGIEGGAPSAVSDFYNGALLIWLTGNLAGQRTSVSDYDGATQRLTVIGMTSAPNAGDVGILV